MYPVRLGLKPYNITPSSFKVEKKLDSQYVHFFTAIEPNKFSPTLVVVAENGSVVLETQAWASSFGVNLRS